MEGGLDASLRPRGALGSSGTRVCFRADGVDVTVEDCLVASELRGEWELALTECLAALAAWESLADDERTALEERVLRRETRLRRDRRLTSADDYADWLRGWDLTIADCRGHLRRALARELGRPDLTAAPPDGASLAVALRADLVVTGYLDRAQRALAQDVALGGMRTVPGPDRDELLASVVARGRQARERRPGDDELRRIVAEHAVDWTALDVQIVATPDADVARELIACVVVDGGLLQDVADGAGLRVEELHTLVEDLDPGIRPSLIGARQGDVVGPVPRAEEQLVVSLRDRVPPSLDDDAVRARATAALLEQAITDGLAAHVQWSSGE